VRHDVIASSARIFAGNLAELTGIDLPAPWSGNIRDGGDR
jgi:hypothetical protein